LLLLLLLAEVLVQVLVLELVWLQKHAVVLLRRRHMVLLRCHVMQGMPSMCSVCSMHGMPVRAPPLRRRLRCDCPCACGGALLLLLLLLLHLLLLLLLGQEALLGLLALLVAALLLLLGPPVPLFCFF